MADGGSWTRKTASACIEESLVVDRYFRITSTAIRKYDPNHLFLGSRFYGSDLSQPAVFRAAGPHLDIVSVNWYHAWSPDQGRLAMWEHEAGKPVLFTEWYAKGMDSGLSNRGGAGWVVQTQRDRGQFYENFTLGLLESKVCIGWDWFKYMDNDPADTGADPSNRDSNKGILSNRYEPYDPLLAAMKRLNERTYALVAYLDQELKRENSPSSK
jgi:O-glycosyl hydrolase